MMGHPLWPGRLNILFKDLAIQTDLHYNSFDKRDMAEAENTVTLKLLVDKKNHVVLFAEAGKDFIDFLFHILALPVGTVIRLLGKSGMVGSLGNLYDSIENLNDTYYIKPSSGDCEIKGSLLKPKTPTYIGSAASTDVPLLLPPELTSSGESQKTYYRCPGGSYSNFPGGSSSDCRGYVAMSPSATCPRCSAAMNQKLNLVEAPQHHPGAADNKAGDDSGGGYVKGVVTYMVMDNLVVKPMSTISSITLLNKINITDLNSLDEKVIEFGMKEGVALLKASLQSKTVLTDVFLSCTGREEDIGIDESFEGYLA